MIALIALMAFILGLAIGITTVANTHQQPTKREQDLEHALTVIRKAAQLPVAFWDLWAAYVAHEAAEAADFARDMAADERRAERARALRELEQLGVLPLRPPDHQDHQAEDIRVEIVEGDEPSNIEDTSGDGGTPVTHVQPVRILLAAVPSDTIEVLLDSHRIMFMKLYDEAHLRRDLAKTRLAEALANADILPLVVESHEDYVPGDQ